MVLRKKISVERKAFAICFRKELKLSYGDIAKKCGISKSSARQICGYVPIARKRCFPATVGRPKKLQERDRRILIRTLKKIRATNVNFTLKQLLKESGLNMTMESKRTFYRILHESGYYFLQARQKGLVSGNDRKKRLKYAKEMKCHLSENPNFWKDDVAFYLDAVSFIYKGNPMSNATVGKERRGTSSYSQRFQKSFRRKETSCIGGNSIWKRRYFEGNLRENEWYFLCSVYENILIHALQKLGLKGMENVCFLWIMIPRKLAKPHIELWNKWKLNFIKFHHVHLISIL